MLKRLLVSNRGEIAVRIFRAARDLGVETVGVYPAGDHRGIHLQYCDRAELLPGKDPRAAYLDADGLLAAARRAGADAIHPGYGFLSENPDFARRVEADGLVFVGPLPETMEAFGVKTKARRLMEENGVPTVPGTAAAVASAEEAAAAASRFGYPIILKASFGGGGRGIRVVPDAPSLPRLFEAAASEAALAFGNGELYVEKLIEKPRHIEVQVLGDGKGGAVHFYERDCSMQRRNQKLIEESPAPNLDPALRARILEDALRAARAGRYRSAGTVEFLVEGGTHHFLEVNARLQVEHPVTEAVTGVDLVRAQLELAGGEAGLPDQGEIAIRGAAVEFRINAEDARSGFLPSPGRIERWAPPTGPGVRVDGAGYAGGEVSAHFDSLLAKLIVHGSDRDEALARARRALEDFVVTGVRTTIPFHRFALASAAFKAGVYSTATVGELGPPPPPAADERDAAAIAGVLASVMRPARGRRPLGNVAPWMQQAEAVSPFGAQRAGWFHEL